METRAQLRLRQALTEVDVFNAYQAAVDKGIAAGVASWSDRYPDNQLAIARNVAMREFARLVGWDLK